MIDKNNIEFKIFEYHEGDLSPIEKNEVLQFIKDNPDYQVDFNAFEKSKAPNTEHKYEFANELLVNQGGNGKGFLKWSLGGGLFLISILSMGLFHKMNQNSEVQNQKLVQNINSSNQNENISSNEIDGIGKGFKSKSNNKRIDKNAQSNINEDLSLENSNDNSKKRIASNAFKDTKKRFDSKSNSYTESDNTSFTINESFSSNSSNVSTDNQSNGINKRSLSNASAIERKIKDAQRNSFYNIAIQLSILNSVIIDEESPLKTKLRYKEPKDNRVSFQNNKDPFYANEEGTYLSLNPSFSGSSEGVRLEYYYRTEWPNINNGNYVSQLITLDTYVDGLKGAVGIIYKDDVIGHNKFNTRSFGAFYSPKIKVGNALSIDPSVRLTNTSRSVQWSQMGSSSLVDPRTGFSHVLVNTNLDNVSSSSSESYNSLGFGLLINHKMFYVGASYDQVNPITYDFNGISKGIDVPNTISAQAGTEIKAHKESLWSFSPSFNYIQIGDWSRLWFMQQIQYRNFFAGAGGSLNEAFITNFGYNNKTVRLAYSYGLSKPPVGPTKYFGSHQLVLRINFLPAGR